MDLRTFTNGSDLFLIKMERHVGIVEDFSFKKKKKKNYHGNPDGWSINLSYTRDIRKFTFVQVKTDISR